MKKLGILAVALLAQVTFAQTNRFVYQVTSKPDINNKSDIKTENAYLDISAEKSMFYSENRIKRDSVMKAKILKQKVEIKNIPLDTTKEN